MKLLILLQGYLAVSLLFFSQVWGQDIASAKLGDGFVYSPVRSAKHGEIAKKMVGTMFRGMKDLKVEVGVYEFNGTFEEATQRIPVSANSDVTRSTDQYAAVGLGMFLALVENLPAAEIDTQWLEEARNAADRWGGTQYRSYRVSQGEDLLKNDESVKPGDKVELYTIECQSPFVDYGELQVVPGTWAIATRTTFTVYEVGDMADDSDYGWGDEESVAPTDVGVALFPGAQLIDPDETSYSDLLGEVNYLVEKPVEEVKSFYLNVEGKHCSIDDESVMAFGEGELLLASVYCLDHAGEVKEGDDVIAISLFKAPPEILSDLLGRNQGVWTMISFNRWVEEEY
jgi:hypothetical protein